MAGYRYLIGYIDMANGTAGNIDCFLKERLRSRSDIDHLTEALRNQGIRNPMILSFSLYEEDQ